MAHDLSRRALTPLLTLPLTVLPVSLARAQMLEPTPRQNTGPYYPLDWSGDDDPDLVRVVGQAAEAQGLILHLAGRILTVLGEPVPAARVEIWQCDWRGIYRHPRDRAAERDPGFQGRGRLVTGPEGRFAFRTIRPVLYPGRTPHIHLLVAVPGRAEFITQLYFEGEAGNERDVLFSRLSPAARAALTIRAEPAQGLEPGALRAERDIILA